MQGMLTMNGVLRTEKRRPARTRASEGQNVGHLREAFGLNPTQYYQPLNALLDDPAFIALDPVFVLVLRSRRDGARHGRRALVLERYVAPGPA